MVTRRLTWSLGTLLLASLSCNVVPPSARLGSGPGQCERSALEVASEAAVAAFFDGLPTRFELDDQQALGRVIVEESLRAGLPVELVLAVILVESSGNASAVSKAGAIGLMQLRPSTAEAIAAEIGMPWSGPALLFDPVTNVRLGVAYLERLIQRYPDLTTALAAYNWGPTRIAARLRRGQALPAEYPRRVLAAAGSSALRPSRS